MITIYFIYDKNAPESNDGNNADDTNASMDKSIAPPSKTSLDTTNRKNTTENTNNNDHPTMIMLIDNCFSWQDKPLAFSWDTTNPQTKQTPMMMMLMIMIITHPVNNNTSPLLSLPFPPIIYPTLWTKTCLLFPIGTDSYINVDCFHSQYQLD